MTRWDIQEYIPSTRRDIYQSRSDLNIKVIYKKNNREVTTHTIYCVCKQNLSLKCGDKSRVVIKYYLFHE